MDRKVTADAPRRMLQTTEREMQRLLLDIHDGPVQHMYAALSQLDLLRRALESASGVEPEVHARAGRIQQLLETGLGEIRSFIGAFRPPEFQVGDLRTLFEDLLLQHTTATDTEVSLEAAPLPAVSLPVKIALYRILQESLSNAYRHGGATRVKVTLASDRNDRVQATIADNGCGFDLAATTDRNHFGLAGMRDRVDLIGGTIAITSAPGAGTTVTVEAPTE